MEDKGIKKEKNFLTFFWQIKHWWITTIVLIIVILIILIVFVQSAALLPFIYELF